MTLTLVLLDDARVVVKSSGTIEYHSITGRTYRKPGLGSYAASAEWVRERSAWRREVRYSTETHSS